MKNSAIASEIADPYAVLEAILKITGRSWLSEEWRLEDIRLLTQDALATRSRTAEKTPVSITAPALEPQIHFKVRARPHAARRGGGLPA